MIKVSPVLLILFFYVPASFSQDCERFFSTDSVSINHNSTSKTFTYKTPFEEGQMQVALTSINDKYYLKIFTSKILYFDLTSNLEIISDDMSIVFKDIKLTKASSQRGLLTVEVQKNYITTLKNNGITEIKFNKVNESVPKRITKVIRTISTCFLNQIHNK